jgi:O-acetyl-ADP-ribose deacetylase (regulator of RNase III)
MTRITYRQGDATAPVADGQRIICHICNDMGGWGKGFVVAISKRWPEPEAQYRAWHGQGEADGFRLGAIRLVRVEPTLLVANMIAQRGMRPSNGVPPIRYEALRECLSALAEQAVIHEASVHMPRIGCGPAGGTWPEVEAIIDATLSAAGIEVYVYDF